MMELLLVVCLQAEPSRCEERSIGIYPDMSAMTCVIHGQPQIAVWTESHPGLTVSRWTCRGTSGKEMKA